MGDLSGRATTITDPAMGTGDCGDERIHIVLFFVQAQNEFVGLSPMLHAQPPQQLDTHSPLMWCSQHSSHCALSCSCCWSSDPSPGLARAWEPGGWRRGREQGPASPTHYHSPTRKDTEGEANKIFKVEVSQIFTNSPNFPSSFLLEITKQNITKKKKITVRIFSKSRKKQLREETLNHLNTVKRSCILNIFKSR